MMTEYRVSIFEPENFLDSLLLETCLTLCYVKQYSEMVL